MQQSQRDFISLLPLGHEGEYQAQNQADILDVSGNLIAKLGLVPPIFVNRSMAALRKAESMSADDRVRAIVRAGKIFATEKLNGLSVGDYEFAVSRVSGVPISVVRAATQTALRRTAQIFHSVEHARPDGAVGDWRHPHTRSGRGVWARRGNVLAIHAVGNHPGTHTIWPEALALGYRVAVRPSRQEPFTPHRLVAALRAAGFGTNHVVLLPSEHEAAEAIFQGADFAYGGDEIIRKYVNNPKVLSLRPGRSKILLTSSVDWRNHLDTIIDSISHHGGTGCVNATAVFVEGDVSSVAEAIKERLSVLPSLPPEDERAVLPVQNLESARTLANYVKTKAAGTRVLLGSSDILFELGDGSAVLRPAIHQLEDPNAEQAGIELPFPCVWVAPWSPNVGIAPLRNTLVLTVFTNDERLMDSLVNEPTISNIYHGDYPTYWTNIGMPHDGYLAEFLMRTKTVIRS